MRWHRLVSHQAALFEPLTSTTYLGLCSFLKFLLQLQIRNRRIKNCERKIITYACTLAKLPKRNYIHDIYNRILVIAKLFRKCQVRKAWSFNFLVNVLSCKIQTRGVLFFASINLCRVDFASISIDCADLNNHIL